MDAQSEDEATKVFKSSLAQKSQIISRPSAEEDGSTVSDGSSPILRSAE